MNNQWITFFYRLYCNLGTTYIILKPLGYVNGNKGRFWVFRIIEKKIQESISDVITVASLYL